ncbi:hypothetical protein NSU01_24315 [Paenibacillus sp. FSL H8-0259]
MRAASNQGEVMVRVTGGVLAGAVGTDDWRGAGGGGGCRCGGSADTGGV